MRNLILSLLFAFSATTGAVPSGYGPVIWGTPYPVIMGKGGIRFQNSDTASACNAASAGSFRYNAGTFETCANSTWTALGSIAAGTVTDAQAALAVKPPVTVVAVSNLTLSGAQTIDGQLTVAGTSIVLATAQSTGAQNGPWIVQSGAWTRPTWYASGSTTQSFQFITTMVRLGSTYQGTTWRQTAAAPITIDTTATTWAVVPFALSTTTTTGLNAYASGDVVSTNHAGSPYTIPANARLVQVDLSGGAVQLNLPDPTLALRVIKITTSGASWPTNLVTMHRFASEKIGYVAADLTFYADQGNYELTSNLTDWLKTSASNNTAMINFTSTTFVIPATVTSMYCEGRSAWGGGGGGASGGGGSSATPGGGGGSGSAASLTLIVGRIFSVTPAASIVVTIGAHGTGGLGGLHKTPISASGQTETASATPATAGGTTSFGSLLVFNGGFAGSAGGANATFSSGGTAGGNATGLQYSNAAGAAGGNSAAGGTTAPGAARSVFGNVGSAAAGGTSAASTGGGGGGGGGPGAGDGDCITNTGTGGNGALGNNPGSNGSNGTGQTNCPGMGGGGGGGGGINAGGTLGGDGGAGADGVDGSLKCRFQE